MTTAAEELVIGCQRCDATTKWDNRTVAWTLGAFDFPEGWGPGDVAHSFRCAEHRIDWEEAVEIYKRDKGNTLILPLRDLAERENLTLNLVMDVVESDARGTGTGTARAMAEKIKGRKV